MTPEELKESVERFTKAGGITPINAKAIGDAIQTINALVQLVGEMSDVLGAYGQPDDYLNVQEILTKAAPIAELERKV